VVRERDFRLLATRTLDLSTDGMLVPTDVPVLTGEDVVVSFRVPNSVAWVDCDAIVARVVHGRRARDAPLPARAIGLAFESLSLWDQLLLRSQLDALGREQRTAFDAA
jgi:hypothetical protein